MLGWAVAFLIAAVIVAILGFAGSATTLALMAKVLFWVFVVGMVVSLAMYLPGRIHGLKGPREHRRRGA
ncbi:MAG: DUF1328 domain-containing protein [Acidobacteriia bacterium]|nr:DUF1328 domain-containing protein [Terriglobia bacterium]